MERLVRQIRRAIAEDRVVFSVHADNQLASRGIERWQTVEGFDSCDIIDVHSTATPNPKVRARQLLPDGSQVIAVWSYVRSIRCAKLVTVFFED